MYFHIRSFFSNHAKSLIIFSSWSNKAEEIFRWTAEEMVGKTIDQSQLEYHINQQNVSNLRVKMTMGKIVNEKNMENELNFNSTCLVE